MCTFKFKKIKYAVSCIGILILFFSRVHASDTTSYQPVLRPIGFIKSSNLMLGFIGTDNTIEYETPSVKIEKAPKILSSLNINYEELLMSSIKSLLFESKNYRGSDLLSSYSVFANGNYSVIDDRLLGIANKFILKNRTILDRLYNWALPSYRETFQLLTYEEQKVQKENLDVAGKYIELVWKKRNSKAFHRWVKHNGIEVDEKVIGFIKRRIIKGQWTVADCTYWIDRVKKDFMPLMKDPAKASSHYQIIERINEKLYIAVDGKGYYIMINEQYKPLTHSYVYIIKKEESLIAMRSDEEDDFFVYSINEYNQKGAFTLLPFPEWDSSTPITDSSYVFTSRGKSGIYDHKNKRYILDSCEFIRSVAHSPYVIAKKLYNVYSEIQKHDVNHYLLYDYRGKKLSDEAVFVEFEKDYSTDEVICNYNVATSPDKKIIAFVNEDKKAGIIDSSGKLIASFQYEWVDLAAYPKKVECGFFVENKMADTFMFD